MTESESDRISKFFDLLIGFMESIEKVPKWRLFIAFLFLGEEANKNLLKLKGI